MIPITDIFNASILIVDDSESNVMLMIQILSAAGYLCISSTMNSSEVCELHRKHRYDLILLDLHMPGMDGFEVMHELQQINPNDYVPTLVITAQPGQKLRALASGAKDFISKPFDMIEIKTRIYNMLEVRLLYKQLEQRSRELESMALHDVLTGLPNRRLFMDRLALAIAFARRNKCTMAVMFLDLDGFKLINDTWGHDVGDTLLSMVATRLLAAVRQEDTVARLGGDEFAIVMWGLGHGEGMVKLVTKIILATSQPFHIKDQDVNITTSVGVSIYPAHGEDEETLLKNADLALYEAKRSGKNRYRIAAGPAPLAMAFN